MAREVTRRLITASASSLGNWSSPLEPGSAYQLNRVVLKRHFEWVCGDDFIRKDEIVVAVDHRLDVVEAQDLTVVPFNINWEIIPFNFCDYATGKPLPAEVRRPHYGRS
jgi:hypothetical protein